MKKIIVAFFMVLSLAVYCEDLKLTLNVDSQSIRENESVGLSLTIENGNDDGVVIEGIENFNILQQGTSQSYSFINGKSSSKIERNLIIMAKKSGKFTLKAVVNKGKRIESNVVSIEVGKATKEQKKNENIYIESLLPKEKIYVGEKTAVSYILYSAYNIENYGFTKAPKFDGFIANAVDRKELKNALVEMGGRRYLKYELYKSIIYPVSAGNLKLDEITVQANVITDGGFFSTTKPVMLTSEVEKITALPLPEANKPYNFSGVVGKLMVESSYSNNSVKLGDSIVLKVKLFGEVNLDGLDKVIQTNLDGFKVYQSEKDKKEEIRGEKYYSEKNFEIVLVPEKGGKIEIPEILLPYFNTATGKYENAKIRGTIISVSGGSATQNIQTTTDLVSTIDNQITGSGDVIEVVKAESENENNKNYFIVKIKKTTAYIIGIVLVVLVLITMIVVLILKNKPTDKTMKGFLAKIKKSKTDEEVYNTVNEMVKYKFEISIKSIDMREIENSVKDEKVSDQIIELVNFVENKKYGYIENINIKEKAIQLYKTIK